jgi:glyoxylase-like metal-dependent hydrolase (beta-lactamase superfamily II)
MERILPGLSASAPQPLPFAPSLTVRAFRLERAAGDLVVYGAETLEDPGDVAGRYFNHWHEAMFAGDASPTFVHERDRDAAAERTTVDGTFSERATLDGDFELIPIPGHTPGATAFLWDSGEHRMLFTGDSVFLDDGEWVAAVVGGSDRASYVESLELLRGLEFDVLVPWAATAGRPPHAVTDATDARRRIGAIADRLRRGGRR